VFAHEYTHSWNGKFRRGADLRTPNFNVPMQDSLLWVYEGQTQYWGNVLAARAGFRTPEEARDALASVAGRLRPPRGPRLALARRHHQPADHQPRAAAGLAQLAARRGLLHRRAS
jgi:predicted metalloprotease with PDZ domain